MTREPAVAGSFYPASRSQLLQDLETYTRYDHEPKPAKAIIVPHAGYMYSGAVAGEIIAATQVPRTVLLLGPNHQGLGHDIAVSAADSWKTPLGEVPIAKELRDRLCAHLPQLEMDERAHRFEHSLEVMLPFLQTRQPALRIVPIALRSLSLEQCLALGHSLANVVEKQTEEILLLASSDMNHFLDADTTEKLDSLAISAMTRLDPEGLYRTVTSNNISMCGLLPTVVIMQAAKDLGAETCQLLRHTHSGAVNGDNSRVVGYASLMIE